MNTDPHFRKPWPRVALFRRLLLLMLVFGPTLIATGYMARVLPYGGRTAMEFLVVILFSVLYAWVSIGFWTAMAGLAIRLMGTDRYLITNILESGPEDQETRTESFRTAVVMPIYNEDTVRVYAGIATMIDSLDRTGRADGFDFFILGDPGDPDIWADEVAGWFHLCRQTDGFHRVFYRRRGTNIKRKSGNVADFCRRWGKSYRYFVVLDADSIMTGETLVRMVEIMERRPGIGILQTAPRTVNQLSLIARLQQFTNRLYGEMFAAGLNFWQLGDSQFWGHNAVIRTEPFMRHCALPILSGKPPLGGDILSHDFVEAAFMRRAGYEVWLAYDLEGTYEEVPPTLLDELQRDRRWCQGNMQHLRLIFGRGLYGAHRALFLNGAMSYVSALLWFLFLAASSIMVILREFREPDYFPSGKSLFPEWPAWEPQWAMVLLASTVFLLFLPKACCLFSALSSRKRRAGFGGFLPMMISFLLEIIVSTLLAPIRMIFHAKFVFATFLGRQVSWSGQYRGAAEGTAWREAFAFHTGGALFAVLWGGSLFVVNRSFFWWLSPIVISLSLAVPVSVALSRKSWGEAFRRFRLFLIPEEVSPSQELQQLSVNETRLSLPPPVAAIERRNGFVRTIVDPGHHALHLKSLRRTKSPPPSVRNRLLGLVEKAVDKGPAGLTPEEKTMILSSPLASISLHRRIWSLPDPKAAAAWGLHPSHNPEQRPLFPSPAHP